jgi:hypothetical protein
MIFKNEIILSGKCRFFRYFDPNGRPYTSIWLKVAPKDTYPILVEVSVNEKDMQGAPLKAIRSILEPDTESWVIVSGQIVNKKDKKSGKNITRIKTSLSNIEAVKNEIADTNEALICGNIEKRTQSTIVLSVPYRNIKTNEWKKRSIPILIPSANSQYFDGLHRNAIEAIATAKRACVLGEVSAKTSKGDELLHVISKNILPIK